MRSHRSTRYSVSCYLACKRRARHPRRCYHNTYHTPSEKSVSNYVSWSSNTPCRRSSGTRWAAKQDKLVMLLFLTSVLLTYSSRPLLSLCTCLSATYSVVQPHERALLPPRPAAPVHGRPMRVRWRKLRRCKTGEPTHVFVEERFVRGTYGTRHIRRYSKNDRM